MELQGGSQGRKDLSKLFGEQKMCTIYSRTQHSARLPGNDKYCAMFKCINALQHREIRLGLWSDARLWRGLKAGMQGFGGGRAQDQVCRRLIDQDLNRLNTIQLKSIYTFTPRKYQIFLLFLWSLLMLSKNEAGKKKCFQDNGWTQCKNIFTQDHFTVFLPEVTKQEERASFCLRFRRRLKGW